MAKPGEVDVPKRFWGKIARLPKELRDGVNYLLCEGVPSPQISRWLKERHRDIEPAVVRRWYKNGHQAWLRERERLEEMNQRTECVLEMAETHDKESIHEASMRVAASQLYDVFSHFDIDTLKQMLKEKPEQYASLLGALTRLSKGRLDVEKFKVN